MPISITCPGCGKRLKAKDELAGRVLPCPNCKEKVTVPKPEGDIAGYLLEPERPAEEPAASEPPPEPEATEPEPEPAPVRRPPRPAPVETFRRKEAPPLPPLSTNEPPLWLRHLHWLLVLALLPLAFSLLDRDAEGGVGERLDKMLEDAPPDVQGRVERVVERMAKGEASFGDLIAALPEQRLPGAFLPRDTFAHWGFAAGSTVLFMAFFLFLASGKTAEPLHLLGMGLFTATIGILLLLLLQLLADWSQGVWLRGGNIVVLIFYVFKLIGFSYRAALDPQNGFLRSFMGYTLGVGFCEEVCKALPLLVLYRRNPEQSWRTAFLWGLASGAGFGIAEGILYASRYYNGVSGGDVYLVRFVSCVALHALWTGSVGITLHHRQDLLEGVDHWYEYIPRLVAIVGVPMVLHGLYDTLLKKEMNAGALGVAVLSFLFLAFQISRLHGSDDAEAKEALLREYKRRRAAVT